MALSSPIRLAVTVGIVVAAMIAFVVLVDGLVQDCYYDHGNPLLAPGQTLPPTPAVTASAASLMGNAHFRNRLLESADAATARIQVAEHRAAQAGEQTKAAKRDQTAVEKLMDRARLAAIRAEMRALEDMPSSGGARRNRHAPC